MSLTNLLDDFETQQRSTKAELRGDVWFQFDRLTKIQEAAVTAAQIVEKELAVFELHPGMPRRDRAVIQNHVGRRRPPDDQISRGVLSVALQHAVEAQLEPRVEELLRQLVLGHNQKAYERWLQRGFEERDLLFLAEFQC